MAEVQMVFTKVNGDGTTGDAVDKDVTPFQITEHGKMYFIDTYGVAAGSEDLSIGSVWWELTGFYNMSLQTRNNNTEDWVQVYTELIKVKEGTDENY